MITNAGTQGDLDLYQTGVELLQAILRERGEKKSPLEPKLPDDTSLPESWCWASPDQLASIGTGATPKRGNSEYYENGTIPWVTSSVVNSNFVREAKELITAKALQETNAKLYPKHTLLIALYGEGKTRGKITELLIESATNQAVAALVFNGAAEACRRFVKLFFEKHYEDIRKASSGGVQPNLNLTIIKETAIPFPPLPEQRRIVARIDELFSRLDAGVAALRHAKAQLQRYRQSVLAAAVTGQLTQAWREQHPDTEPAADVIARTEAPPRPNRYKSRSKAIQQGHPALSVGNPGTSLPKGWAWAHLVEIARMESGHTPSRNHPEWWDGDIPWIGIADAREHHGTVINETFQHTNEEGLANSASRLLPAGTVCISRTASVGYVTVMGCAMATSQDFVNWIPTKAVTSEWLRLVFQADTEGLRSFGSGSVHKTIYFPEWLSMHAAIPPLAEQHRIVAEVEARTTAIDHLEAELDRQITRSNRLRQSTLASAFKGEL